MADLPSSDSNLEVAYPSTSGLAENIEYFFDPVLGEFDVINSSATTKTVRTVEDSHAKGKKSLKADFDLSLDLII